MAIYSRFLGRKISDDIDEDSRRSIVNEKTGVPLVSTKLTRATKTNAQFHTFAIIDESIANSGKNYRNKFHRKALYRIDRI